MGYPLKKKQNKFSPNRSLVAFSVFIFVAIAIICTKFFISGSLDVASAAMTIQPPLSTSGAKIIDTTGKKVLLKGINWFGIESETHVPHGLWKRDYKEMLTQIQSLGYNLIRLPYSVQALRATDTKGIDYSIGNNKDLEGKTPLEVMDLIIQEAERQNLLILLDNHRLNDQQIPELWYGDGFTEADWIDSWKMLAQRYKNQANVIGADLKNEPHGKASWGTGDLATDWRLAAQRAGNAIGTINPDWLIVVEGVEKNIPKSKLKKDWWGGNLEGVKHYPVRLSIPHKLVYSPHEYGAGVNNQPWFSEPNFPKNLLYRWQIGFNYISSGNIAPIFIGEFGGRLVDTNSKEGIWQQEFVKYIQNKDLSFAYWSWNPDSSDTGGILLDDWQTVDISKQKLLSQILGVNFAQNLPVEDKEKLSSELSVTTDIYANWQTGFCTSFKIANHQTTKVSDWQLTFNMKAAITNSWNASFQHKGETQYVVTPLEWERVIEPNQQRDIGFCANKLGSDFAPQEVEVKGQ